MPHYQIAAFKEESDGRLFVKTVGGIAERRGEKFALFSAEYDTGPVAAGQGQGISFVSGPNAKSFSTFDLNGVHSYEKGRYKTYGVAAGLPQGKPAFVYQDQQETLWISTRSKRLFRLKADSTAVQEITIKGGLPDAFVEAVYDDRFDSPEVRR